MRNRGYYGIGCINMKTNLNYGSLFRTAQILDASFIYLIGKRFKKMPSDTMKSWKHIPLYEYETFEDFYKNKPYDCLLIGIELDEKSKPLRTYCHPEKAIYLLGAEDSGIPMEARKKCNHIVQLPGERSMNVAVAGSIVLYDRISKMS